MRITLISETYFPQINGVSRTLDRLTRFLTAQGDRVQLLIPRYREDDQEAGVADEIHAYPSIHPPFYRELYLPLVRRRRLRRTIAEFAPQVVHIATEGPLGWNGLRATRRLRLPLVTSYHTNYCRYLSSYRAGFLEPLFWRYLRWFHNHASTVLCPAASIRELLAARGFRRVEVWGRGVDCVRFDPAKRDPELRRQFGARPDEVLLLYAGRVANEKNLPMLIDAFARLPESVAPVRLLIVGDGPLRVRLERNNRDSRILFAGYRTGEELASCYASADLFVFPSLTETFGNVMLEAMAAGLPVVAFDVPGPRDVVEPGRTGVLSREVAADALAAKLVGLLPQAELRQAMAARAREHALAQSWDRINAVVRQAYLAAANGRRNVNPAMGMGK